MDPIDKRIDNVNLASQTLLPTPAAIKTAHPSNDKVRESVIAGRKAIRAIIDRRDPRLFIVVGPCSIHDPDAAREYAQRLSLLANELSETLLLVMRVYFEKPRTTVGWKGLINDPEIDDSFQIEKGLALARSLLLEISELGLPCATEALDPISPQYISDLISWAAIGARTTESQTHREMASGLSMPVGIKNGTDGSLDVAINALHAVSRPHHFLGINQDGKSAVCKTYGNDAAHIVLRGGSRRQNYDSVSVALCERTLVEAKLPVNISIDCSHDNSSKDPALQPLVADNCVNQIVDGNRSLVGLMLESNLNGGNQPIPEHLAQLKYGVSITDACIDWDTTESLLRRTAERLAPILPKRRV